MTDSQTSPTHTFGRFSPIAQLGRGGMADVHLVVSQGPAGFNKLLVLKQLRSEITQDQDFVEMFLDEGRLAARPLG